MFRIQRLTRNPSGVSLDACGTFSITEMHNADSTGWSYVSIPFPVRDIDRSEESNSPANAKMTEHSRTASQRLQNAVRVM